jgi:pSer/pThr/pTyr-binding forkhead associated (FHA) protein
MRKSTSLAWLIVNEGSPDEFQVEITKNTTTLGRESDCDIQVSDPLSSRLHAVIYFRADGYEIEDQNSSNGTFVNEMEITIGPVVDGDLIRIGNTTLLLKTDPDPDATIIQERALDETVVALHPTIPHEHGAVLCRSCGQPKPKNSKFCPRCGSALPQLPATFQKSQEEFENLQIAYQSGKLIEENYQSALAELVVQDDEGDFWMLGVESGEWYWHDGDEWHLRLPPLHLPDEQQSQSSVSPTIQNQEQIEAPLPSRSMSSRWGVVGLWFIGVLIVLVFGIYAVTELISFSRTGFTSQINPNSFIVAEEPLEDAGPASGESPTPNPAATLDTIAQESRNDIKARPYDPAKDGSLLSLTADAEYLADQSTEDYEKYTSNFFDTNGILIISWCAIDKDTLNNNLSSIEFIGTLDGVTIPPELWTEVNTQEEGMVCRIYRSVVEDLESGSHRFFWSTRYDVPINDGWETYQPGTYINEFTINIAANIDKGYLYQDDFESDGGHWGELDLDEVRTRIEGSALHIELYQPSINAINNFREREFEDFTITCYARSLGDTPGMYGIIFRSQDDQNHYFFQVTDQRYYRLGKKTNETIDIIPWTTTAFISGQGESNKLTVTMEGDQILVYINDQQVVDIRDSTFQSGGLGLVAGSPAEFNGYHAVFDQVSIEAPE